MIMKCEIESSNGIMYLKGIDGDKQLEIADYIKLHESSLFMVSLILDKKGLTSKTLCLTEYHR